MKQSRFGPGRRNSDRRTPERGFRSTREGSFFSEGSEADQEYAGPAQSPESFAQEARKRKGMEEKRVQELEERRRAEREKEAKRKADKKEWEDRKTRRMEQDREERINLAAEMERRRVGSDIREESVEDERSKKAEESDEKENRDKESKDQVKSGEKVEERRVKIASVVHVVNLPEDPQRQAWYGPQTLTEFNRVYDQRRDERSTAGANEKLRRPREEKNGVSVNSISWERMEIDKKKKDRESAEKKASREAQEDLEQYVDEAVGEPKNWRPLSKAADNLKWRPAGSETRKPREWDDDYQGPGKGERKSRGKTRKSGETSEKRGRSRSSRRKKPYNPNRQWTKGDYFGVGPSPPRSPSPPGRPIHREVSESTVVTRAREERDRRERNRDLSSSRYPVKTSGTRYQNVKLIPTVPTIDPPPGKCFNCWQKGHRANACPRPVSGVWCSNCGRRHVILTTCPRCSEAAQEALGTQSTEPTRDQTRESNRPEEKGRVNWKKDHGVVGEQERVRRQEERRATSQSAMEDKDRRPREEKKGSLRPADLCARRYLGERPRRERSSIRPTENRSHAHAIDDRDAYLSRREIRDAVNSTLELMNELRDVSPETKNAILKKIFKE